MQCFVGSERNLEQNAEADRINIRHACAQSPLTQTNQGEHSYRCMKTKTWRCARVANASSLAPSTARPAADDLGSSRRPRQQQNLGSGLRALSGRLVPSHHRRAP
ncbi:unnamed protein product [Lampetra planeri]